MVISRDLSSELKEVKLIVLADWHLGDPNTDIKLIKKWIKVIEEEDNVYCILNGDLINNAIKNSVSELYTEDMTPDKALDKLEELLKPISHKIIAVLEGNHERRTAKEVSINLMKELSVRLGIRELWSDTSATIFLRFGSLRNIRDDSKKLIPKKVVYTIYVTHGNGAGAKNAAEKLKNITKADIYIHSHTHQPDVKYGVIHSPDARNNVVAPNEELYVVTGATLNYGGYGEIKCYQPQSKRNPVIVMSGERKYFYTIF